MTNLTEENLTKLEWHDSDAMFKFGVGTIKIAEDYQEARKTFALSLKNLKIGLANEYSKGNVEKKHAVDKAFLILADKFPNHREDLMNLIDSENQYKGLEKVLETRQAVMSLAQSLIKNRIENE